MTIQGLILPPCTYQKFNLKKIEAEITAECSISIDVNSKFTIIKQFEAYPVLTFLAEFGGYLGLFTGLSLYTLSSIVR